MHIKYWRTIAVKDFEKGRFLEKLQKAQEISKEALKQLPDLWKDCARQVVDQQNHTGQSIFESGEFKLMD